MLRLRFSHLHTLKSLCRRMYVSKSISVKYAVVSPSIIPKNDPPPLPTPVRPVTSNSKAPWLDQQILEALDKREENHSTLVDIIGHYLDESGNILSVSLPYEPNPSKERQVLFDDELSSKEVVAVAHCARDGNRYKITLSSGFALDAKLPGATEGEMLIATCAHTLEEIRQSPIMQLKEFPPRDLSHHVATGTFICIGAQDAMQVYPASRIVAAIPQSDVVLISCALPRGILKSLPVSPYPVPEGTRIRAHFVHPQEPHIVSGWKPWVGNTWGTWMHGKVTGYRDFAGKITKPGTYDALSHMLFTPFPTAGSSGGPVVCEETSTVVGMMIGSRMDSQVAGIRGWGIPAETIFEMFSLPGLEGKK